MIQQSITIFLGVDYNIPETKGCEARAVILFNYEIFCRHFFGSSPAV